MTEYDIERFCAELASAQYDLQVEADIGHAWLRPFVSRLAQFADDLKFAADEHLPIEAAP